MRALVPLLAASFAAGLALGDRCPMLAALALAVSVAALACAVLLHRHPRACVAATCGVALAAGAALLAERVARALPQLRTPAQHAVLEGRVVRSEPLSSALRVELDRVAWVRPKRAGPERVEIRFDSREGAPPLGATVRIAVRTRELRSGAANPGESEAALRLARRGIGASARALDPLLVQIVEDPAHNPLDWLAIRRLSAIGKMRGQGRGGALLAALSLGDQAGLPERDRRAWAALGIAHLLSVSGLHLALAAAAAYALAARALARHARLTARFDSRRLALAAAIAAATLYALLAGLATPALRSLAMLACLAAAVALRRPAAPSHALAGAALAVLAIDPAALFAAGAQLSFAATAALVLGRSSARGRLPQALAGTLSSTALATLATAPIAALHFGAAPPLAGAANLIAVPLTAVLGMPLAFVAAACALLAPHATPDAWFAAAAWPAERALDGALALAELAPRVAPHPPQAAALLVSVALAWLGLRTQRLGVRLACAFLAQAVLALAPAPLVHPSPPRFVFLDVGHGDATLVQADDFALLVDAGGVAPDGFDVGARIVVPALAALGVRRLDALAITHADLDHRGGAPAVLDALPCRELWLPHGAQADPAFTELLARARERGVRIRELGAGSAALERPGVRVTVLWPPRRTHGLGDNDRSLVLRVALGGTHGLLLGDLEARGETALVASGANLRADVVKLGHHGSRSSTTPALLAAVAPRLAIVSAPLHGRFGWPDREVRERLAASGIALVWTARDGALLIGSEPRACVRRWRHGERCLAIAQRRGRLLTSPQEILR